MELRLAQTLSRLLKEKRMTLSEVSRECGVSVSTLSEWQTGRSPRNVTQAAKVAKCLGVSLHYLLFGENDTAEPLAKLLSREEVFAGTYEISVKRVK